MRISGFVSALSLIFLFSCTGSVESISENTTLELSGGDREEIMEIFLATQEAWNDGDLEGFMKGYLKSEKLVFTGVGGPTYGYDATLERYIKGYPNEEAMGVLKFTVIDLNRVDNSTALMIGKFYLSRTIGDLVGHYTLVWQKIDGEWLIISDHSSGQEFE